jgi:hypothetical protein
MVRTVVGVDELDQAVVPPEADALDEVPEGQRSRVTPGEPGSDRRGSALPGRHSGGARHP